MTKVAYAIKGNGFSMSKTAINWMKDRLKMRQLEFENWYINAPVHDPLIIECIETLGTEVASGENTILGIKEIEGNKYSILDLPNGGEMVFTPEDIPYFWIEVD